MTKEGLPAGPAGRKDGLQALEEKDQGPRRRHHPRRTCLGCRGVYERSRLMRVAIVRGRPVPDPENRTGGRGAYICCNHDCLDLAFRKKGAFSRALRQRIEGADLEALYDKLEEAILSRHDGGPQSDMAAHNKPRAEDRKSI